MSEVRRLLVVLVTLLVAARVGSQVDAVTPAPGTCTTGTPKVCTPDGIITWGNTVDVGTPAHDVGIGVMLNAGVSSWRTNVSRLFGPGTPFDNTLITGADGGYTTSPANAAQNMAWFGDLTSAVAAYQADIAGGHVPFYQFDAIGLNFEEDPTTVPACTDKGETIAGMTWSSGTAAVTTSSAHGLGVGSLVDITNVTPSGYNGDAIYVRSVPTSTTFTFSLATNPGAYTSGGSANSWCDYRDQHETFQKFWCLAKPTDAIDCGPSRSTRDLRVVIVASTNSMPWECENSVYGSGFGGGTCPSDWTLQTKIDEFNAESLARSMGRWSDYGGVQFQHQEMLSGWVGYNEDICGRVHYGAEEDASAGWSHTGHCVFELSTLPTSTPAMPSVATLEWDIDSVMSLTSTYTGPNGTTYRNNADTLWYGLYPACYTEDSGTCDWAGEWRLSLTDTLLNDLRTGNRQAS